MNLGLGNQRFNGWNPGGTDDRQSPVVPPVTPGNSSPVGIAPFAPLRLCAFALNSEAGTL